MGRMASVFDGDFDFIQFSVNKPTRFRPIPGMLSEGLGILSAEGSCPRPCEPSDCTEPGPDCFGDEPACECYDIEGDPIESDGSGKVGGRCDPGHYCLLLEDGNPCEDCCQPQDGMANCRRNWRLLKSQNPNSCGDFSSGPCGLTPGRPQDDPFAADTGLALLSDSSGEYSPTQKLRKSCGCSECYSDEEIGGSDLAARAAFGTRKSKECCGQLINDVYSNNEGPISGVSKCKDGSGNVIEYTYKPTGQKTGDPLVGEKRCFQCWCEGEIEGKYKCELNGSSATCEKIPMDETGGFNTIGECEAALVNGATDCGIHWKCESAGDAANPCTATKDPADDTSVYLKKTDCVSNCEVGWNCKIVDGHAKCVEEVGGEFRGDDGKQQCDSALASGSCGIRYECKVENDAKSCSPTESTANVSTIFSTELECEQQCQVEFECDIEGSGVVCRSVAAYRPSGSPDPGQPNRFNRRSECESAVANDACGNISFRCRMSDGKAECIPEDGYFGLITTRQECEQNCETRYKCDVTPPCGPVAAVNQSQMSDADYFTTEQECCEDCCECPDVLGKCTYQLNRNGFSHDICSTGFRRSFCDDQNGQFTCCSGPSDPACECPDCEEDDVSECIIKTEFKKHRNGECWCQCNGGRRHTVDGGPTKWCFSCGENSDWNSSEIACVCEEGYETDSGGEKYLVSTDFAKFTPGLVRPANDIYEGHTNTMGPPCVPKKYKCDTTKNPPECVLVPQNQRDGSEASEYECESRGCGRYNCVGDECVPADVDNDESGEHVNKTECDKFCGKYECGVEYHGNIPRAICIRSPSGIYDGEQECEDAGCGKFACVGGTCVESLSGPYGDYVACDTANCGKWLCLSGTSGDKQVHVCRQNLDGTLTSGVSGSTVFNDEPACVAGGCGKYECDNEECKPKFNGKYSDLVACESAKPLCFCPGEKVFCKLIDPPTCVDPCTEPDFLVLNDTRTACECGKCEDGKETITDLSGVKHCCDPCDEVLVAAGVRKRVRVRTRIGCGDCCTQDGFNCPDVNNDPLRSARKCTPIEDDCEAKPQCKDGAEWVAAKSKCDCKAGHKLCEAQNRCIECNDEFRTLNQDTCVCACKNPPTCSPCQNWIDKECACITPETKLAATGRPSCFEVKQSSPGVCVVRTKICPPGLSLRDKGIEGCKCVCPNGNEQLGELPCDNSVPGPEGPFPPGGGGGPPPGGGDGGGDGDGDGGGEPPDPCGENQSLDPESGLCFCSPGYVTMDGGSPCGNCAPGYARDANGGCCDPFNTPGGCDLVGATGFEPEGYLSSMCDGVNCPEGQSCFQSVFGAECR